MRAVGRFRVINVNLSRDTPYPVHKLLKHSKRLLQPPRMTSLIVRQHDPEEADALDVVPVVLTGVLEHDEDGAVSSVEEAVVSVPEGEGRLVGLEESPDFEGSVDAGTARVALGGSVEGGFEVAAVEESLLDEDD